MAGGYKGGGPPPMLYRPNTDPGRLDMEKASERFAGFWPKDHPCPVCNHVAWRFGEYLAALYYYGDIPISGGNPVYPCVVVVCTNCGHTLLFNAKVLGLE